MFWPPLCACASSMPFATRKKVSATSWRRSTPPSPTSPSISRCCIRQASLPSGAWVIRFITGCKVRRRCSYAARFAPKLPSSWTIQSPFLNQSAWLGAFRFSTSEDEDE
ncbi:hypothetical protein THIX_20605 [Thiomonas sp. X19]|nr:hypothetical protein THIX_20605 [Thiomonas sp. X19]